MQLDSLPRKDVVCGVPLRIHCLGCVVTNKVLLIVTVICVVLRLVCVCCHRDRQGERIRLQLVRRGRQTRRTGGVGSTFLTGVDRRVHAPLGTVINFAGLLRSRGRLASRRGSLFHGAVGGGDGLLLGLVGSVLRLSHVRSKQVSFTFSSYSLGRLLRRVCRARRLLVPSGVHFLGRFRRARLVVRMSHFQFARIVAGFVGGTIGFAAGKRVLLKTICGGRRGRIRIFIRSAKGNVSRRTRGGIFRHFFGISRFTRNAKLNLSVYRAVTRHLRKQVALSSRRKGNDHFALVVPYEPGWGEQPIAAKATFRAFRGRDRFFSVAVGLMLSIPCGTVLLANFASPATSGQAALSGTYGGSHSPLVSKRTVHIITAYKGLVVFLQRSLCSVYPVVQLRPTLPRER